MRPALALILAMSLASCASGPSCGPRELEIDHVPRLGELFAIGKPACVYTMAASAQFWPSFDVFVDRMRFTIGVDDRDRVRFVSTGDARFRPPEGLRIGDPAEKATAAAGSAIQRERGWGSFVRLPSGWYALVDDPVEYREGRLQLNLGTQDVGKDARITMFFLREY